MEISSIDLAYIAGFFDGEGSIIGAKHKGRSITVRVRISQQRTEILYWIQKVLDMGKIRTSHGGISSWGIIGRKDTERFIKLILPYSKVKKKELKVGQKLNNLIGESNYRITSENYQERIKLYSQLRRLKHEEMV